MKNHVTSGADGQVEAIVEVVSTAAKNAARVMAEGLNTAGRQRVLAQGGTLCAHLVKVITEKMTELAEQVVGFLKLISGGKTITIGATDGQGTIAEAKDTFPGYLDSDFENYGTNVKGQPTKAISVQVYELIKNGTFTQIFGGFGENLDRLCLSQDQIIRFCRNQAKWLRSDGYATFFLFKVNGEFFVAFVRWYGGWLDARVYRLSRGFVWLAGCRHRVVVPQL